MGSYSDNLLHRIRARRAQRRVKWPAGFDGAILWCSKCAGEMLRVPKGSEASTAAQRAALESHELVCPRRNLQAVP